MKTKAYKDFAVFFEKWPNFKVSWVTIAAIWSVQEADVVALSREDHDRGILHSRVVLASHCRPHGAILDTADTWTYWRDFMNTIDHKLNRVHNTHIVFHVLVHRSNKLTKMILANWNNYQQNILCPNLKVQLMYRTIASVRLYKANIINWTKCDKFVIGLFWFVTIC